LIIKRRTIPIKSKVGPFIFDWDGTPFYYQTVVIGGPIDGDEMLSGSWDTALITHRHACIKSGLNPDTIREKLSALAYRFLASKKDTKRG